MSVPRSPPPSRQQPLEKQSPSLNREIADVPSGSGTQKSVITIKEAKHEESEICAPKMIKLPSFWKDNPALWFLQVEASFALWRISSNESKYRYVLVHLDASVLPFVSDIISTPSVTGKYDALKKRIVDSFDETSKTKLRKLLRGQEFTTEKPSNLLQKLRNLAGGQCNDIVLRTLFLEQLPDNVRTILAISEVSDLSKLALQADKIFEMSNTNINQVCTNTENSNSDNSNKIVSEINELKATIESLTGQLKGRRSEQCRSRSRSRSMSKGRFDRRNMSPAPSQQEDTGICYYYRRFGKEAYHCLLPCNWKNENSEN